MGGSPVLLKRKAALKVYDVITAKFEKPGYLIHFLPVVISKEGKERDFNNTCTVGYKKQGTGNEFTFKHMQCGYKAVM